MGLDLTGRTIGNYEITRRIGAGGMSTVYRARQTNIGRDVAIKVLIADMVDDPALLARFEREVRVIAELEHPRILPVYDYGEIEGLPYIVMAYMSRGSLTDRISRAGAGLPLDEVIDVFEEIAEGMNYAHLKGVIHRDLKPSNVLLDAEGNPRLADFGIAKISQSNTDLTGEKVIGTLSYMAPEMFRKSEQITSAVDIYALGVMLYQMLTGEVPYSGDTAQIVGAHLHQAVPDIRQKRPDLPVRVQDVINRAMAKDPTDRYLTALDMATDLSRAAYRPEEFVATQPEIALEDTLLETPPARRFDEVDYGAQAPAAPIPQISQQYVEPAPPPQAPPRRPRRRRENGFPWLLAVGGFVALLLCLGAAAVIYFRPWETVPGFGGPGVELTEAPTEEITEAPPDSPTEAPRIQRLTPLLRSQPIHPRKRRPKHQRKIRTPLPSKTSRIWSSNMIGRCAIC